MNAQLAVSLLIQLLSQADQIAKLLQLAKSEGRDVTDAELDALVAGDDAAKKALQDAIDAKK